MILYKEVTTVYEKLRVLILAIVLSIIPISSYAENIDPDNDGSQYAWGENVGWINFEPSSSTGVTVTDTAMNGYAWGENIGWIPTDETHYVWCVRGGK